MLPGRPNRWNLYRTLRTRQAAAYSPLVLLRHLQRGLTEDILPARRRTHIGVAEPQKAVERLAVFRPFLPQLCRHNRCISPDAHRLVGILLVLPYEFPAFGFLQQVLFGVRRTVTCYKDEAVRQYAAHGGSVVGLHGSLVLGIEYRNGLLVV